MNVESDPSVCAMREGAQAWLPQSPPSVGWVGIACRGGHERHCSGDGGGALGVAAAAVHAHLDRDRYDGALAA